MTKIKNGYKESEIGIIPEDWTHEKLEKLCTKITDGTHKTPKYTYSGIPFLRVTDIQSKEIDWNSVKYISKEEHQELIKRCNPEAGDILYSKNGTIGIPKIIDWDREFSIFVSLCLIKIKEGAINKKYLEQFLKSNNCLSQIKLRAKQGTVTNLHLEEIRELDIALPNHLEQQRIAEILSSTDAHIEKLDKIIEDYQLLKKGMMKRLLTEGIGHTEFKETEIGRIPKEWEVKTLKEVAEIISGGTPSTSVDSYWAEGDILWATPTDVTANGKYINNTEKKITKQGLKNSSANMLPIGSILMTSRATIGERCINRQPMSTNQGFKSFICRENCYNEYLYYYIDIMKPELLLNSSGSTFKEISKAKVEMLKIAVPSLNEQHQIVDILSQIDNRIEFFNDGRTEYIQLKKALMEQLLTGKIRVI